MNNKGRCCGFTLIEMSIVLVIIALVIGGVMMAKDLKKQAEIRSVISQINRYQIAVNSFKLKYGDLPGDLTAAKAAKTGLATRAGTTGRGDGNKILQANPSTGQLYGQSGEANLFWNDLSTVLSGEQYFGADCNSTSCSNTISLVMPSIELGEDNYIAAHGDPSNGQNYFRLINFYVLNSYGQYYSSVTARKAISGVDAFAMDNKADDGLALTGKVTAATADNGTALPTLVTPAAPAAGVCVSNASGNPYNYDPATYGNVIACNLRFEF